MSNEHNETLTPEPKKGWDVLDRIVAWESGELSEEDTIELFQHLVDTGMAWRLQGCYGRTAQALIEAGLVTRA
jgi:hypothetical protein